MNSQKWVLGLRTHSHHIHFWNPLYAGHCVGHWRHIAMNEVPSHSQDVHRLAAKKTYWERMVANRPIKIKRYEQANHRRENQITNKHVKRCSLTEQKFKSDDIKCCQIRIVGKQKFLYPSSEANLMISNKTEMCMSPQHSSCPLRHVS